MPIARNSQRFGLTVLLITLLGALMTVGAVWETSGRRGNQPPAERYELADVQRTDLFPKLTASGRIESSKRTLIECELENITIGILGQRFTAGGASYLLSVVPDGSVVHKGDVLAVLDASDYDELLRQQRITVERARSDHRQAELNYEIAKLAVREFREGSMEETLKDFERTLAMARSEVERSKDRLEWALRMKQKGYVAAVQASTEEVNHARALFNMGQQRAAFELFTHWTAPRTMKVLEGQVLAAESTLNYQTSRLHRNLERLEKLERQVERCTIRAPHDGFVIYANDKRREIQIEPGMSVRQKQDLFYLPDLNEMEVVASLHESIVRMVSQGMRAKVVVESLPNRRLEGHVTSIAQVPTFDWRSDVRYFDGTVKLDHSTRGLLPGMTAQVDIALERRTQVLAVPAEAIAHEGGQEFCYVAHDDGLERREVRLGEGTRELVEISEGLHEGEQVVLNPDLSEMQLDTSEETPLAPQAPISQDGPAESEPVRQIAAMR